MTRRQLLADCFGAGLAAALAPGARGYPGVRYRDYSRCLPDYLRALAARAYRRRKQALAGLTAPEAIRERQRWVRETFWRLAGGRPRRTPLNARVVGVFERPGYRVEKIVYESQPGLFVPANLYVPAHGSPPFPGVLFQLGHSLIGKAAPAYQKCCQALARLGYVVLAFDPMGQGERLRHSREFLRRLAYHDGEHTIPGRPMLLTGVTATRLMVWDAVRSLDYLASRPEVDPARLASTGNSGGGTLTMMLAAVDSRLAAVAASCPNTENVASAEFDPPGAVDDAEQNFIDAGPAGFARWDLLYPLAPKPCLVLVSDKDFLGTYSPAYIANGWEEFQQLRRVYEVLGEPDRLEWYATPLPHGFAYNMRLRVYDWLNRWLKGAPEPVASEPPVNPEKPETLWVAPGGDLVKAFGSETPFSLNRKRAAQIRSPGRAVDLAALLRADAPPKSRRARVLGRVESVEADVAALDIPSAERVSVPAWLFLPRNPDRTKPALIALEPAGRNARWSEGRLYQALAARGILVCVPDLRGLGDLEPSYPAGNPRRARRYHNQEDFAWASLVLGKPLLGQRVTDLLAVAAAVSNLDEAASRRLVVAARGALTVPALFAAALDERIRSLYLAGGLVSYRSIVEIEEADHPFANYLPGALLAGDLPDLAASVAPRPVWLAGAVDAAGRTLEPRAVQRTYQRCTNVRVSASAAWDAAVLARVG